FWLHAIPANVCCSAIPNLPTPLLDAHAFYHVERLTQSFPSRGTRRSRSCPPAQPAGCGSRRIALALEQVGTVGLRRRGRLPLRECGRVRAPSIHVAKSQPDRHAPLPRRVQRVGPLVLATLHRDLVRLDDDRLDRPSSDALEAISLQARAADT